MAFICFCSSVIYKLTLEVKYVDCVECVTCHWEKKLTVAVSWNWFDLCSSIVTTTAQVYNNFWKNYICYLYKNRNRNATTKERMNFLIKIFRVEARSTLKKSFKYEAVSTIIPGTAWYNSFFSVRIVQFSQKHPPTL